MHFGWVKGHAGIEGNELVDRLAKGAAVEDGTVVYDKMPREVIITRQKRTDFTCGNGSGQIWEGGSDQSFFPISEEQDRTEDSQIPRVYNKGNRTWETKVIASQIWTNR